MPEIAWIMAPTTSLSSVTWPSISFARSRPRAPCASRSSGPDGRTHISPKSSPKSEMRLPCAYLDFDGLPGQSRRRVSNTQESHAALAALLSGSRGDDRDVVVVLEASGGCERGLHRVLVEAGVPAAIVNPQQVREFARSQGLRAKTDRVDARAIRLFGEVRRPRPTPLPEPVRAELIELLGYRNQIVAEITARTLQRGHLTSAFLIKQADAARERLRRESGML